MTPGSWHATSELDQLATQSLDDFVADVHQAALASYYLQRALEDILGIDTHILARLPHPIIVEEYRQILLDLGRAGFLPTEFATRNAKLGSYRNRLVHHYLDVTSEELYRIVQERRVDLRQFGQYVRQILKSPEDIGLTIE